LRETTVEIVEITLRQYSTMEEALAQIDWNPREQFSEGASSGDVEVSKERIKHAMQTLAEALRQITPLLLQAAAENDNNSFCKDSARDFHYTSSKVSLTWLRQVLDPLQTVLDTDSLVQSVWEASRLSDETRQQSALLDVLGASEQAMSILFTDLAPNLALIAKLPSPRTALHPHQPPPSTTFVDIEEERRQLLRKEAEEAAQLAALAQAEVDAISQSSAGGGVTTHTITRASDQRAINWARKAKKRADAALQRAKAAGAILDTDLDDNNNLLTLHSDAQMGYGTGGFVGQSTDQMRQTLQASLLPEGSRQHYDQRGLPTDTIIESTDEYEKAIIPAAPRDVDKLPARLLLSDILTPSQRLAFAGTTSLNPMQSSVFAQAFTTRDNLLVCAPTGAGKTNVVRFVLALPLYDGTH
jgi:hypothetical protein